MAEAQVRGWFEFAFPCWALAHAATLAEHGVAHALHGVKTEGQGVHLQLFSTEEAARAYLANRPLPGYETYRVEARADLRLVLEVARKNGGTHVRTDDPDGRSRVACVPIDDVIAALSRAG